MTRKPDQSTSAAEIIQLHYGALALDFGIGNIPNLFLRFYRYLVHTTPNKALLRLSDAEAMLLVHVMALRADQDFVLRLSNLPMRAPERTREDYLAKFRKMGLVFTSRIYYSRNEMIAYYGANNLPDSPRMRAQQWDLSSLIFNLSLVAQDYLSLQRQAVAAWKQAGEVGPRPVSELPPHHQREVVLPLEVMANIQQQVYYPIPSEWTLAVPAEKQPVQPDVPAGKQPVQPPYQPENSRSSMLTPYGVNIPFGNEPPFGGSLALTDNSTSDDPASAQARVANADGSAGNGGLPRITPAARSSDDASARVAPAAEPPAPNPLAGVNEPVPLRRERVISDLRTHPDRRLQIFIVAANIGQMMGLRWDNGELRQRPAKSDKAEVGKMCREFGGPIAVWETACRIAGHVTGDPLDYLWAALRKQHAKAALPDAGDFNSIDYAQFQTISVEVK